MGQLAGAQGQVKVAKKMQKHPHLWRSPQQMSNQKQKNIFFDVNQKTCWIRREFEQLSSSSGWRFVAKKGRGSRCR